jgi:hypothetical protein
MLLAVILACVGAAPPAVEVKYEFQMRLSDADGLISRPTIRTLAGCEAMMFCGQAVSLGGETVEVGVKIRLVPVPAEGARVQLRILAEVSKLDGPDSVLTVSSRHLRTAEPGEHVRLRVGEREGRTVWLDLDLLRLP